MRNCLLRSAAGLFLGTFLVACGETKVPAAPPEGAASRSASSDAPSGEIPSQAWKEEMEREVPAPRDAGISMHELTGRIAYASTRSGPHAIFTLPLGATTEPTRLGYGMEPVWSPDGRTIACVSSYTDGGDEIQVMNPDGSDVRRLTTAEGQDRGPTWSPDGQRLAFWSERDDDRREIYIVSVDGSSLERLTNNTANDMWPSWSPAGDVIAYESYRGDGAEIFAVSPDGGGERRLTPRGLDAREPAWSPDGSELAFVSSTGRGWALVVMSADGGKLRKLTEAKSLRNPSWSPDGRFLLFAHSPEGESGEDIWIIAADGNRAANLTNDPKGFDWDPSWTR